MELFVFSQTVALVSLHGLNLVYDVSLADMDALLVNMLQHCWKL